MRERALFVEVEALRGAERAQAVSIAALEIHVLAVERAVRTDRPAFVSDECLDALAPGRVTTMAALELCLAGLWRRVDVGHDPGYVVADPDLIDHLAIPGWRRTVAAALRRVWHALNSETVIPL